MSQFEYLMLSAIIIFLLVSAFQLFISLKILHKLKSNNDDKNNSIIQKSGENEVLSEEIKAAIYLKMLTVRNAVHKQSFNIHSKAIANAPHSVGFSEKILKTSYNDLEINKIVLFWSLFQDYLQAYWLGKNLKLKTVFSGDITEKSGEVGKMMRASEELVQKLDCLIEEIEKN